MNNNNNNSELTPSSSSLYGGERGAGGKFRKQPSRRIPASPYDRPANWISKIANKILPSYFSRSSSIVEEEDIENGDVDEEEKADDIEKGCPLNLVDSQSSKGVYIREGVETLGNSFKADQLENKRNGLPGGNDISEIEQLVKARQFSRDDVNRLLELLQSKAAEVSNVEPVVKKLKNSVEREGEGSLLAHETPRLLVKEKQESFNIAGLRTPMPLYQSTVEEEVGASPIDIARAYMGSRVSEVGTDTNGTLSKYGANLVRNDRYVSQSLLPPSPKSSVGWPGAMAEDRFRQSTPQSVSSSRYGLHQFQRSPYSRSIYSKPKSKLARPEAETSRFQNFPLSARQRPQTPIFRQKSEQVHNDVRGSAGPIRHLRRKSLSEASPRGSISYHASQNGHSPSATTNSSLFPTTKNTETGALESITEFPTVNCSEASHPAYKSSNAAARAILEHLDRHVTMPKDRSAELELATSSKNSFSRLTDTMLKEGNDRGKLSFEERPQMGNEANDASKDAKSSTTVNGSYDYQWKSPSEISTSRLSNIGLKNTDKPSVSHNQSEGRGVRSIPFNSIISESLKRHQKPILASISVDKPRLRQGTVSNNNPGFTFPISSPYGILPEPPTPSIMPSTSTGSPPKPKNDINVHKLPSYSFGTKRSTPNLTFSFPSTSNASEKNDGLDIKFNFGSDGKSRLSFQSFGNDATWEKGV